VEGKLCPAFKVKVIPAYRVSFAKKFDFLITLRSSYIICRKEEIIRLGSAGEI